MCVCMCVCACVCICVRACVRMCVCVLLCFGNSSSAVDEGITARLASLRYSVNACKVVDSW